MPNNTAGGTFIVRSIRKKSSNKEKENDTQKNIIWNRSTESRFPESKELKQLVRDIIAPYKHLGHSDYDHNKKK